MPLPHFDNRITQLLGVDIPIANSPMGFVANPSLVAAVAQAGGIGLVPGSVGIKWAREDIKRVRDMTDHPFGVNLPIAFVRDPKIADMLVAEGVPFVTTSAGSPSAYTAILKSAGLRVLHVVTSLDTAKEAVDAGVDGLIVEGIEGAGLRGKSEVATMVLLPLIAQKVDIPLITAGGIADGASMAVAFALGAEGVQMGRECLPRSKQMCMTASRGDTSRRQRPTQFSSTATTTSLFVSSGLTRPVRSSSQRTETPCRTFFRMSA